MQIGATISVDVIRENAPCSISSFSRLASAALLSWQAMPHSSANSEEQAMSDPIIALIVAFGLGAYLVYTLLHPERF